MTKLQYDLYIYNLSLKKIEEIPICDIIASKCEYPVHDGKFVSDLNPVEITL
jgi:hypothetical protein